LRLIIVPRHPHRFDEVATLLDRSKIAWTRRSSLHDNIPHSPLPTPHSSRALLVDTVGELSAWWGTASIGFVGGSLFSNRGGQNMIEPAAYGVATCFGPNTKNFRDVVAMLLAHDAAVCVHSGEELTAFVRRVLTDANYATKLGNSAAELVKAQQGATARTWALVEPLLPPAVVQQDAAQRPAA
jgi:3-deoxy-D-manno-octulosonic-acid transferase